MLNIKCTSARLISREPWTTYQCHDGSDWREVPIIHDTYILPECTIIVEYCLTLECKAREELGYCPACGPEIKSRSDDD